MREVISVMPTSKVAELKGQYYFNNGRNTLHCIGNCCHTKYLYTNAIVFTTLEEAIASEGVHMSCCKICFKDTDNQAI